MSEYLSWAQPGGYRPSYLADEDSVRQAWEASRQLPPVVVCEEPEPEPEESGMNFEPPWDGLWLMLKEGIIDEDRYWELRIQESEGNDDGQSDTDD